MPTPIASTSVLGGVLGRRSRVCYMCLQSNSLPEVEKALQRHGIPFRKAQVEEGGVRVTQVTQRLVHPWL